MPMIDVYAAEGTFADKHTLAQNLAAAVMRWEQVPDLALFRNNTAAFVHNLPANSIANVNGDSDYVRVQVLTPMGVLDRQKQLGVVKELTEIIADAAGDQERLDRLGTDMVAQFLGVLVRPFLSILRIFQGNHLGFPGGFLGPLMRLVKRQNA